jgi:hypothetical protein
MKENINVIKEKPHDLLLKSCVLYQLSYGG